MHPALQAKGGKLEKVLIGRDVVSPTPLTKRALSELLPLGIRFLGVLPLVLFGPVSGTAPSLRDRRPLVLGWPPIENSVVVF